MPRYRPHVAARPSWRCRVCGVAWPCSAAKLALLGEYRESRVALLVYLDALRCEAAADLAGLNDRVTSADLADRFLAWAKPREPTDDEL